jgi:excisionase family DNA binding protein
MSSRGKRRSAAGRPPAENTRLEVGVMTTQEVAEYLRLNERTVLKLAAQGELPGIRLGNQWRFRRAVLDAWLDDRMLGVRQPGSPPQPGSAPTFRLDEGFGADHIIELRSRLVSGVLEELASRAHQLGLVRDKTWFLGALLEREHVLSSAVGDGVAFPHTLHRHPEHIHRPFLLLGRSTAGVDFGAADRVPVHIIALMGLKFQELHVPWLARLSAVLRHGELRSRILAARDADEIHALLLEHLGADG